MVAIVVGWMQTGVFALGTSAILPAVRLLGNNNGSTAAVNKLVGVGVGYPFSLLYVRGGNSGSKADITLSVAYVVKDMILDVKAVAVTAYALLPVRVAVLLPSVTGSVNVVEGGSDYKFAYSTDLRIMLGSRRAGCVRCELVNSSTALYGTYPCVTIGNLIIKGFGVDVIASCLGLKISLIADAVTACAVVPIAVKVLTVLCLCLKVSIVNYLLNVVMAESLSVLKASASDRTAGTAVTVGRLMCAVGAADLIILGRHLLIEYADVRNYYLAYVYCDRFNAFVSIGNGNGSGGCRNAHCGTVSSNNSLCIYCDPGGSLYRVYVGSLTAAYCTADVKACSCVRISLGNIEGASVLEGERAVADGYSGIFACKGGGGGCESYLVAANAKIKYITKAVDPTVLAGGSVLHIIVKTGDYAVICTKRGCVGL